MSRLRNFPNTVSVGMNSQGKLILLPEKANWGIFTKEGIRKVETYSLFSVPTVSKRTRRKPPVKTPNSKPEEKPPEQLPKQQSDESSEKAMFHCTACNKNVDNPKTVSNGKIQCPHCLKIGTVRGKE